MDNKSKITVCTGRGGQADLAASIARRIGVELSSAPGDELTVIVDAAGVSLAGYGLSYRGDFERMLPRLTCGRLAHEMLVHISKTNKPSPTMIDATAGMGEDSILFAAAGYHVTMFEQDPVIAALLKDAMRRAKKHPVLAPIIARMRLIEGNSIDMMGGIGDVDLIYLDPMFPERQKSGLINKKLQLIQHLERPCTDEHAIFDAAIASNPGRIIVKRPLKGAVLAAREPNYTVKGKAIRYDCYTLKTDN